MALEMNLNGNHQLQTARKRLIKGYRRDTQESLQTPQAIYALWSARRACTHLLMMCLGEPWCRCSEPCLQYTYHKRVLGLKKQTPSFMWMLEMGTVPIRTKIDYRMVAFWASLLTPTIHSPRLAARVYQEMRRADSKWYQRLKQILDDDNLGKYWETQLRYTVTRLRKWNRMHKSHSRGTLPEPDEQSRELTPSVVPEEYMECLHHR